MLIEIMKGPKDEKPNLQAKPQAYKPLDENYTKEIMAMSRCPRLASMIDEEVWGHMVRRVRFETQWLRTWYHHDGRYFPEDFTPIKDRSSLFIQRLRERIATAQAKVESLTVPVTGRPWSYEPSKRPRLYGQKQLDMVVAQLAAQGKQIDDDTKAQLAMAAAQKAAQKMTDTIQDYIDDMDLMDKWRIENFNFVGMGTSIFRKESVERDDYDLECLERLGVAKGVMPDKKVRPNIRALNLFEVYFNPDVPTMEQLPSITVRHVLTEKQVRDLAKAQDFDADQIEALLNTIPGGNYNPAQWEQRMGLLPPTDKRWIVWERVGLVPEEIQKEYYDQGLAQTGQVDPDPEDAMDGDVPASGPEPFECCTGFMESWTCGPFILKLARDPFFERELPFAIVPMERQYGTLYGKGFGAIMEDLIKIQNAAARAFHDDLASSSIPRMELDMMQLGPDANLEDKPGKKWQARPNELSNGNPAVRYFLPPSNAGNLLNAMKVFEEMVPTATSLPMVSDGRDMGSNIRSVGQQAMLFQAAETFIKIIVGNHDLFYWKPIIKFLSRWAQWYEGDDELMGDIDPKIEGVKGAIQRELIGMKVMDLANFLNSTGMHDYVNNPKVLEKVLPAFGLDGTDTVLSPAEVAAKKTAEAQMMAQQEQLKQQATESVGRVVRAASSRQDFLLQLAKSIQDSNPAWGATLQEAMESQGAASPALYAGLKIWAYRLAQSLNGQVDPSLIQNFNDAAEAGFVAHDPSALDPAYRPQGSEVKSGVQPPGPQPSNPPDPALLPPSSQSVPMPPGLAGPPPGAGGPPPGAMPPAPPAGGLAPPMSMPHP